MAKEQLTILMVDDESAAHPLLKSHLSRVTDCDFEHLYAGSIEEARRILAGRDVDVVFLDYELGPETGISLLRYMRSTGDIRPVIMLTGRGNEYIAAECTRAGADEYLCKSESRTDSYVRALTNARHQYQRRRLEREQAAHNSQLQAISEQLAEANIQLAQAMRIDPLTGVLNRGAWFESASLEDARSRRHGHRYSVIMLDVDHFKRFNDARGHQAGDSCLKQVAGSLFDACRAIDLVGRYGGEEFVVLATETDLDGAAVLAERIRQAIENLAIPHPASPTCAHVTASLGVADGPIETGIEAVVQTADEALYHAKRTGRNGVRVARPATADPRT